MHALLIDLDGVLYEGERPIEGAVEAIRFVQENRIKHLFVTNTTSRPRRVLLDKLARMGIATDSDHLLTPIVAARMWLSAFTDGPAALFIPEATREDLADFEQLDERQESGAASVVVGDLADGWTFRTLNRAFRLLMCEPRPPLVALGTTRYWHGHSGLQLDAGPFVKALEYACGIDAVVMGKPASGFFHQALALLDEGPEDTVMIGDDIVTDVLAAGNLGIKGLLVKTGKFRPDDLAKLPDPDMVLDSIAKLPGWLPRRF